MLSKSFIAAILIKIFFWISKTTSCAFELIDFLHSKSNGHLQLIGIDQTIAYLDWKIMSLKQVTRTKHRKKTLTQQETFSIESIAMPNKCNEKLFKCDTVSFNSKANIEDTMKNSFK